ncbi:MAG: glycoside hydrolase family 9 protein [Elusimicrobia bacterium]|nr:glycoside hydrolase family 9 protein [Elusimicrobiota bacterium]
MNFYSCILVFLLCLSVPVSAAVKVTVTASSTQNNEFKLENAFDNNMNTRWSSDHKDDQWIKISFDKAVEFDCIKIFWERAYTKEYNIEVSNDNTNWRRVHTQKNGRGGEDKINISKQSAKYIKILALKRGTEWGNSIFEIVILSRGRPLKLEIEKVSDLSVDVNQAFYGVKANKTAVVRYGQKVDSVKYEIADSNDKVVASGEAKYWGSRWGKHFWTINFTEVAEEGNYFIRAKLGDRETESKIFISDKNISDSVAKTLFYFYTQRCGVEIPGWHKLCHTDDGKLPNGKYFKATGGWHDCAGFDKEMYTNFLPVYIYTTIAFESDLEWKEKMLEEARWGADWIMQMTDNTGYVWCHVQPHNMEPKDFIKVWADGTSTDNIPGNWDDRELQKNAWHPPEEAAQAANMGALVKMGYLMKDKDRKYSAKCIEGAKKIRRYLTQTNYNYPGLGSGNSPHIIFHSGMLLGDIYLYKLEKNEEYLNDAHKHIDYIINKCQVKEGEFINTSIKRVTLTWETIDPYFNLLVFYEFYKNFPDDPYTEKIKKSYKLFFDKQLMQRVTKSPYGQAQILDKDIKDYAKYSSLQRDFGKVTGLLTSQGKSPYWLSMAIACFYANEMFNTDEYAEIGINQIDWVIGKNPFGLSTVAEIGYKFPRMFTMWYWLDNHPASEGVIPGGAINGIGGDKNGNPFLDLNNHNWVQWETNEYWNPPTAWYAMAAWQYYKYSMSK